MVHGFDDKEKRGETDNMVALGWPRLLSPLKNIIRAHRDRQTILSNPLF